MHSLYSATEEIYEIIWNAVISY